MRANATTTDDVLAATFTLMITPFRERKGAAFRHTPLLNFIVYYCPSILLSGSFSSRSALGLWPGLLVPEFTS
jgi:hypothetical protein